MENKRFKLGEKGLVSIVLTYFNQKDYIIEQLESILNQTYQKWELIIMDDCSADNSEGLFREFIVKNNDRRIKYFRNEKNLGLAKNFEKGLEFATGEFIAACDPDDVWFSDKLQSQVDFLEKEDYGMVYSDLVVVGEDSRIIKESFMKDCLSIFVNPKDNSFEELINDNHVAGQTIIFRFELKEKIIPFSRYGIHDHWIALMCSMCSKIGFLDKPTVYYRQHSDNMVGVNRSFWDRIFFKKRLMLEKHLQMKRNGINYFKDLTEVSWIEKKYKKIIQHKIEKLQKLVGYLSKPKSERKNLKNILWQLWKLKAYREILQILYFQFQKNG